MYFCQYIPLAIIDVYEIKREHYTAFKQNYIHKKKVTCVRLNPMCNLYLDISPMHECSNAGSVI